MRPESEKSKMKSRTSILQSASFCVYSIGVLFVLLMPGCSEKRLEDTPEQRKVLALEFARLSLNSGSMNAYRTMAIDSAMQVFAPTAQIKLGRELTQSEYQKCRSAMETAFDEVFPNEFLEMPAAKIIAEQFDSEELKALLKFQRSPLGMKMLRTEGVMASELHRVIPKLMENKKEEFQNTIGREFGKLFGNDTLPPGNARLSDSTDNADAAAVAFRNDFFQKYPELEPYESVVDAVANKLQASGYHAENRETVMAKFAEETRAELARWQKSHRSSQ